MSPSDEDSVRSKSTPPDDQQSDDGSKAGKSLPYKQGKGLPRREEDAPSGAARDDDG